MITGVGGGIGSAIAEALFSSGCKLVLMERNSASVADEIQLYRETKEPFI